MQVATRVEAGVVGVALVEIDRAAKGGGAEGVPVAADAGDDAVEVMARTWQWAEAQRVEQGDGPCSHRDDVADDAADPGRRALVGLDGGGMVVRFDLEHRGPARPYLDRSRILARSLQHRLAGRGQPAQEGLGRFV